jgi:hypothetical protein
VDSTHLFGDTFSRDIVAIRPSPSLLLTPFPIAPGDAGLMLGSYSACSGILSLEGVLGCISGYHRFDRMKCLIILILLELWRLAPVQVLRRWGENRGTRLSAKFGHDPRHSLTRNWRVF